MFTDREEVIKLCKSIKTLKSSGFDDISSRICRDAFLVITEEITFIFNCSLHTGIFSDVWKVAKVIPLFKGGESESKR